MPHTSSSFNRQLHVATAFHLRIFTFIALQHWYPHSLMQGQTMLLFITNAKAVTRSVQRLQLLMFTRLFICFGSITSNSHSQLVELLDRTLSNFPLNQPPEGGWDVLHVLVKSPTPLSLSLLHPSSPTLCFCSQSASRIEVRESIQPLISRPSCSIFNHHFWSHGGRASDD